MYYNYLVNIPKNTSKISRNKRGKTTYIEYTYAREYLPEKKYNVARRIIEDYKLAEHLNRWDDRGKGLLLDLAKYQN